MPPLPSLPLRIRLGLIRPLLTGLCLGLAPITIGESLDKNPPPTASVNPNLQELPNPFLRPGALPVQTLSDWESQRKWIRELLLHHEYGHAPAGPFTTKVLEVQERSRENGAAREVTFSLEVSGGTTPFRMRCGLVFPTMGGPRFPVILAIDPVWQPHVTETARKVNQRGYAFAGFHYHDVDEDKPDRTRGVYPAFPSNDWATLAAWAWAASRLTDHLMTRSDVDPSRLAITGHSRCGKAALLAGALDERFQLTAPHASGAGGAGSFRIQPKGVETLDLITDPKRFHYWFHPNLRKFAGQEDQLPFDQHFLKALVAPRALLSMEAMGDTWANPTGTWQTHRAAREVFRFLDAEDRLMAWYRPGGHDLTTADWETLLDAADHVFKKSPLPEILRTNPDSGTSPAFSWRAPNLQAGKP